VPDNLLLLGQLNLLLVAQLQRVRVVEHGVDILEGPGLNLRAKRIVQSLQRQLNTGLRKCS
jgi:hypothetical protein